MPQHQLAVALGRDEPLAYHDTARHGFFSTLVREGKHGEKRMVQRSFKLDQLRTTLQDLSPARDAWISQSEFRKPNRKVVNLWRLPVAFVDLDTYKVPHLGGLPTASQVYHLLNACEQAFIPPPTLVVASGRGLQVKWVFEKPVPSGALPRWQAVENALCTRLEPLGADFAARDASRVLRVVDTVNTKSGALVRVVHQESIATWGAVRADSGLIVHDFEVFADTVLPVERADLEREREARDERYVAQQAQRNAAAARGRLSVIRGGRPKGLRTFVPSELAWARICDIRKLVELRGWSGGAPAGERDVPLFLCACFLAQAVIVPNFMSEVTELAREFAPTWTAQEVKSCVSSVLARAGAAARGEMVEFKGKKVDRRYRYKTATLIELLRITPEEERALTTIISETEVRRRGAARQQQRRRAGGAAPREDYLRHAEARREAARAMRAAGASWQTIAQDLGYANAEAARNSVNK